MIHKVKGWEITRLKKLHIDQNSKGFLFLMDENWVGGDSCGDECSVIMLCGEIGGSLYSNFCREGYIDGSMERIPIFNDL